MPRRSTPAFPEVFGWLAEQGTEPAGAPFILYHVVDMDGDLEIEVGVPVPAPAPASGRIRPGILPGGRYVTLLHNRALRRPGGRQRRPPGLGAAARHQDGIPPTGRPIEMRSIDIWRVHNGEFAEHWDELNMLEVFQQLGVIPPIGPGRPGGHIMTASRWSSWPGGPPRTWTRLMPPGVHRTRYSDGTDRASHQEQASMIQQVHHLAQQPRLRRATPPGHQPGNRLLRH